MSDGRSSLGAVRRTVSREELSSQGYGSVADLLREELADEQGAGAGFYDGVNGTNSVNIGLSDEGRRVFRISARSVISRLYPDMRSECATP